MRFRPISCLGDNPAELLLVTGGNVLSRHSQEAVIYDQTCKTGIYVARGILGRV